MGFSNLEFTASGVSRILAITLGTSSSAISLHWLSSDQYVTRFPVAELGEKTGPTNPMSAKLIPNRLNSRFSAVCILFSW